MTIRPFLLLLALIATLTATAQTTLIVLNEHLNRTWTDELLTYPVVPPAPKDGGTMVPSLTGPDGPVPCQLHTSDSHLSPELKESERALSFIVPHLAPRATHQYQITWTEVPANSRPALSLPNGQLTSGKTGLRIQLGTETYDPAKPAGDVPGPIAGWQLADGTWTGGSHLYGTTPITSRSVTILEQGPVFTRVQVLYTYDNKSTLTVTAQVAVGDYAAIIDTRTSIDAPEDGWELLLQTIDPTAKATAIHGQRSYSKPKTFSLPAADGDQLFFLSPWCGDLWFPDSPGYIALPIPGQPATSALLLTAIDTGLWVKPNPRPDWSAFNTWDFPTIMEMWSPWQRVRAPIIRRGDRLALQLPNTLGMRRFTIGTGDTGDLVKRATCKTMSIYGPLPRLNTVKDMVLAWPDSPKKHPHLLLDPAEFKAAAAKDPKTAKSVGDIEALRQNLDLLGTMDLMRNVMAVAGRYDAVIDNPALSADDRALFKAQFAYLLYCNADPYHWSFERGQNSGNPNMTLSRLSNHAIGAAAIPGHPMSKPWIENVEQWMLWWLENVTDETGGWPESSHYARVSWADYVHYAIVTRRAGYQDLLLHPKFRAMATFYEATFTPPDPMRRVRAGTPVRSAVPYGRGTRGGNWGLSGLLATAYASVDPEFSKTFAWAYRESGFSYMRSHSLAGLELLYIQKDLPVAVPAWTSTYYPSIGYLLRNRVGTPTENYLLFMTEYYQCPDGQIWPADTGAIAKWFVDGTPIGGSFRRIPETSVGPLVNRVIPAINWDPAVKQEIESGFHTQSETSGPAFLPHAQYTRASFDIPEIRPHHMRMPKDVPALPPRKELGTTPLTWLRQLFLAQPPTSDEPTYLVLRDTVTSDSPTQFHFWTLTNGLYPATGTIPDRKALQEDKALRGFQPSRQIKGDHFTAPGQFTHDVEYYIAEPTDTPRYTLRYGTKGSAYGARNFLEYQDALHLQLENDGSYYLIIYPHTPDQPAPTFTKSADGNLLRLTHHAGTDWTTLAGATASKTTMPGGPTIVAAAAAVQQRATETRLILASPGSITHQGIALAADGPVTLIIQESQITAEAPSDTKITLALPKPWKKTDIQATIQAKTTLTTK